MPQEGERRLRRAPRRERWTAEAALAKGDAAAFEAAHAVAGRVVDTAKSTAADARYERTLGLRGQPGLAVRDLGVWLDADAKKSPAPAAAEVAALRELRRHLMAGLGCERLAAAETAGISTTTRTAWAPSNRSATATHLNRGVEACLPTEAACTSMSATCLNGNPPGRRARASSRNVVAHPVEYLDLRVVGAPRSNSEQAHARPLRRLPTSRRPFERRRGRPRRGGAAPNAHGTPPRRRQVALRS